MIPCVDAVSKLLYLMIPEKKVEYDPNTPEHLDPTAYIDPNLALANAVREVLSLGDFLQKMFVNLNHSLSFTPHEGESSIEMKNRIRDIAEKISEYLAGATFDSKKQRRRMNKCLIASADVSECAQVLNLMIKRIAMANSVYQESFVEEVRTALKKISDECSGTVNLALNAFFTNGKDEKQKYFEKKDNALLLITQFSSNHMKNAHLNREQDMRFSMLLLELIEQYRHICVIFDPLLTKTDVKTNEGENSDDGE